MTHDSEGQVPGTVTALRRPPVRQSVLVRSDQRHTFDAFVDTIGIWWPVTPFSAGKDRVRDVTFERRAGAADRRAQRGHVVAIGTEILPQSLIITAMQDQADCHGLPG